MMEGEFTCSLVLEKSAEKSVKKQICAVFSYDNSNQWNDPEGFACFIQCQRYVMARDSHLDCLEMQVNNALIAIPSAPQVLAPLG